MYNYRGSKVSLQELQRLIAEEQKTRQENNGELRNYREVDDALADDCRIVEKLVKGEFDKLLKDDITKKADIKNLKALLIAEVRPRILPSAAQASDHSTGRHEEGATTSRTLHPPKSRLESRLGSSHIRECAELQHLPQSRKSRWDDASTADDGIPEKSRLESRPESSHICESAELQHLPRSRKSRWDDASSADNGSEFWIPEKEESWQAPRIFIQPRPKSGSLPTSPDFQAEHAGLKSSAEPCKDLARKKGNETPSAAEGSQGRKSLPLHLEGSGVDPQHSAALDRSDHFTTPEPVSKSAKGGSTLNGNAQSLGGDAANETCNAFSHFLGDYVKLKMTSFDSDEEKDRMLEPFRQCLKTGLYRDIPNTKDKIDGSIQIKNLLIWRKKLKVKNDNEGAVKVFPWMEMIRKSIVPSSKWKLELYHLILLSDDNPQDIQMLCFEQVALALHFLKEGSPISQELFESAYEEVTKQPIRKLCSEALRRASLFLERAKGAYLTVFEFEQKESSVPAEKSTAGNTSEMQAEKPGSIVHDQGKDLAGTIHDNRDEAKSLRIQTFDQKLNRKTEQTGPSLEAKGKDSVPSRRAQFSSPDEDSKCARDALEATQQSEPHQNKDVLQEVRAPASVSSSSGQPKGSFSPQASVQEIPGSAARDKTAVLVEERRQNVELDKHEQSALSRGESISVSLRQGLDDAQMEGARGQTIGHAVESTAGHVHSLTSGSENLPLLSVSQEENTSLHSKETAIRTPPKADSRSGMAIVESVQEVLQQKLDDISRDNSCDPGVGKVLEAKEVDLDFPKSEETELGGNLCSSARLLTEGDRSPSLPVARHATSQEDHCGTDAPPLSNPGTSTGGPHEEGSFDHAKNNASAVLRNLGGDSRSQLSESSVSVGVLFPLDSEMTESQARAEEVVTKSVVVTTTDTPKEPEASDVMKEGHGEASAVLRNLGGDSRSQLSESSVSVGVLFPLDSEMTESQAGAEEVVTKSVVVTTTDTPKEPEASDVMKEGHGEASAVLRNLGGDSRSQLSESSVSVGVLFPLDSEMTESQARAEEVVTKSVVVTTTDTPKEPEASDVMKEGHGEASAVLRNLGGDSRSQLSESSVSVGVLFPLDSEMTESQARAEEVVTKSVVVTTTDTPKEPEASDVMKEGHGEAVVHEESHELFYEESHMPDKTKGSVADLPVENVAPEDSRQIKDTTTADRVLPEAQPAPGDSAEDDKSPTCSEEKPPREKMASGVKNEITTEAETPALPSTSVSADKVESAVMKEETRESLEDGEIEDSDLQSESLEKLSSIREKLLEELKGEGYKSDEGDDDSSQEDALQIRPPQNQKAPTAKTSHRQKQKAPREEHASKQDRSPNRRDGPATARKISSEGEVRSLQKPSHLHSKKTDLFAMAGPSRSWQSGTCKKSPEDEKMPYHKVQRRAPDACRGDDMSPDLDQPRKKSDKGKEEIQHARPRSRSSAGSSVGRRRGKSCDNVPGERRDRSESSYSRSYSRESHESDKERASRKASGDRDRKKQEKEKEKRTKEKEKREKEKQLSFRQSSREEGSYGSKGRAYPGLKAKVTNAKVDHLLAKMRQKCPEEFGTRSAKRLQNSASEKSHQSRGKKSKVNKSKTKDSTSIKSFKTGKRHPSTGASAEVHSGTAGKASGHLSGMHAEKASSATTSSILGRRHIIQLVDEEESPVSLDKTTSKKMLAGAKDASGKFSTSVTVDNFAWEEQSHSDESDHSTDSPGLFGNTLAIKLKDSPEGKVLNEELQKAQARNTVSPENTTEHRKTSLDNEDLLFSPKHSADVGADTAGPSTSSAEISSIKHQKTSSSNEIYSPSHATEEDLSPKPVLASATGSPSAQPLSPSSPGTLGRVCSGLPQTAENPGSDVAPMAGEDIDMVTKLMKILQQPAVKDLLKQEGLDPSGMPGLKLQALVGQLAKGAASQPHQSAVESAVSINTGNREEPGQPTCSRNLVEDRTQHADRQNEIDPPCWKDVPPRDNLPDELVHAAEVKPSFLLSSNDSKNVGRSPTRHDLEEKSSGKDKPVDPHSEKENQNILDAVPCSAPAAEEHSSPVTHKRFVWTSSKETPPVSIPATTSQSSLEHPSPAPLPSQEQGPGDLESSTPVVGKPSSVSNLQSSSVDQVTPVPKQTLENKSGSDWASSPSPPPDHRQLDRLSPWEPLDDSLPKTERPVDVNQTSSGQSLVQPPTQSYIEKLYDKLNAGEVAYQLMCCYFLDMPAPDGFLNQSSVEQEEVEDLKNQAQSFGQMLLKEGMPMDLIRCLALGLERSAIPGGVQQYFGGAQESNVWHPERPCHNPSPSRTAELGNKSTQHESQCGRRSRSRSRSRSPARTSQIPGKSTLDQRQCENRFQRLSPSTATQGKGKNRLGRHREKSRSWSRSRSRSPARKERLRNRSRSCSRSRSRTHSRTHSRSRCRSRCRSRSRSRCRSRCSSHCRSRSRSPSRSLTRRQSPFRTSGGLRRKRWSPSPNQFRNQSRDSPWSPSRSVCGAASLQVQKRLGRNLSRSPSPSPAQKRHRGWSRSRSSSQSPARSFRGQLSDSEKMTAGLIGSTVSLGQSRDASRGHSDSSFTGAGSVCGKNEFTPKVNCESSVIASPVATPKQRSMVRDCAFDSEGGATKRETLDHKSPPQRMFGGKRLRESDSTSTSSSTLDVLPPKLMPFKRRTLLSDRDRITSLDVLENLQGRHPNFDNAFKPKVESRSDSSSAMETTGGRRGSEGSSGSFQERIAVIHKDKARGRQELDTLINPTGSSTDNRKTSTFSPSPFPETRGLFKDSKADVNLLQCSNSPNDLYDPMETSEVSNAQNNFYGLEAMEVDAETYKAERGGPWLETLKAKGPTEGVAVAAISKLPSQDLESSLRGDIVDGDIPPWSSKEPASLRHKSEEALRYQASVFSQVPGGKSRVDVPEKQNPPHQPFRGSSLFKDTLPRMGQGSVNINISPQATGNTWGTSSGSSGLSPAPYHSTSKSPVGPKEVMQNSVGSAVKPTPQASVSALLKSAGPKGLSQGPSQGTNKSPIGQPLGLSCKESLQNMEGSSGVPSTSPQAEGASKKAVGLQGALNKSTPTAATSQKSAQCTSKSSSPQVTETTQRSKETVGAPQASSPQTREPSRTTESSTKASSSQSQESSLKSRDTGCSPAKVDAPPTAKSSTMPRQMGASPKVSSPQTKDACKEFKETESSAKASNQGTKETDKTAEKTGDASGDFAVQVAGKSQDEEKNVKDCRSVNREEAAKMLDVMRQHLRTVSPLYNSRDALESARWAAGISQPFSLMLAAYVDQGKAWLSFCNILLGSAIEADVVEAEESAYMAALVMLRDNPDVDILSLALECPPKPGDIDATLHFKTSEKKKQIPRMELTHSLLLSDSELQEKLQTLYQRVVKCVIWEGKKFLEKVLEEASLAELPILVFEYSQQNVPLVKLYAGDLHLGSGMTMEDGFRSFVNTMSRNSIDVVLSGERLCVQDRLRPDFVRMTTVGGKLRGMDNIKHLVDCNLYPPNLAEPLSAMVRVQFPMPLQEGKLFELGLVLAYNAMLLTVEMEEETLEKFRCTLYIQGQSYATTWQSTPEEAQDSAADMALKRMTKECSIIQLGNPKPLRLNSGILYKHLQEYWYRRGMPPTDQARMYHPSVLSSTRRVLQDILDEFAAEPFLSWTFCHPLPKVIWDDIKEWADSHGFTFLNEGRWFTYCRYRRTVTAQEWFRFLQMPGSQQTGGHRLLEPKGLPLSQNSIQIIWRQMVNQELILG